MGIHCDIWLVGFCDGYYLIVVLMLYYNGVVILEFSCVGVSDGFRKIIMLSQLYAPSVQ